MSKLALLLIALALVVIPLIAARDPHPWRGLKRALIWVGGFNLFFVFFLRFIVPRLG